MAKKTKDGRIVPEKANDFMDLTCISRNYDEKARERVSAFTATVAGIPYTITHTAYFGDEEYFHISSSPEDVWDVLSESELGRLDDMLQFEEILFVWLQRIESAQNLSDLENIKMDFLYDDTIIDVRHSTRFWDAFSKKKSKLSFLEKTIEEMIADLTAYTSGEDIPLYDTQQIIKALNELLEYKKLGENPLDLANELERLQSLVECDREYN